MNIYRYTIGPNPSEANHEDKTKGNGCWTAKAKSMKEALRVIFGSMTYPGEAAGRSPYGGEGFVEGISLPGKAGDEVIQVYSNSPKAVEHVPYKDRCRHWHDNKPDPNEEFLLCELEVTKLDEYLTPITALLAGPKNEHASEALSPMGVSVVQFEQKKREIEKAIQLDRFDIQKRQWAMEELEEAMEERIKLMNQQIGVMNAYLHGPRMRHQICTGKSGTGPYHVFQTRQFLNREIGLLANFEDFDFESMRGMERWLVKTGHIWKMLPYERCILVTRVRDTEKDYGDVWVNIFKNELNMQNMIWIRDGENVFHVDVEFKFDNAVFPDKSQFDKIQNYVQVYVWRKQFAVGKQDKWFLERQVDQPQGQIKADEPSDFPNGSVHKAVEEREPYQEVRRFNRRFKTVEEWLESDVYTLELDAHLKSHVQDYLRNKNKKQMIFCVILQGIVDNTDLLQIPKGTDLFNWENVSRFFTLVQDYTHGLVDRTYTSKFEEYTDISKVRVGDWVIAYLNESHYSSHNEWNIKPWLFKVVAMADVAKSEQREVSRTSGHLTVTSRIHDESGRFPVVMFRPKSKRSGTTLRTTE